MMEGGVALRGAGDSGPLSIHHWREESARIRSYQHTDTLPTDPRNWSRDDVQIWLNSMAKKHHISTPLEERFPMNGKGLCLMTMDMYLCRVPHQGKLLFRDFQLRLARAMHNM